MLFPTFEARRSTFVMAVTGKGSVGAPLSPMLRRLRVIPGALRYPGPYLCFLRPASVVKGIPQDVSALRVLLPFRSKVLRSSRCTGIRASCPGSIARGQLSRFIADRQSLDNHLQFARRQYAGVLAYVAPNSSVHGRPKCTKAGTSSKVKGT